MHHASKPSRSACVKSRRSLRISGIVCGAFPEITARKKVGVEPDDFVARRTATWVRLPRRYSLCDQLRRFSCDSLLKQICPHDAYRKSLGASHAISSILAAIALSCRQQLLSTTVCGVTDASERKAGTLRNIQQRVLAIGKIQHPEARVDFLLRSARHPWSGTGFAVLVAVRSKGSD